MMSILSVIIAITALTSFACYKICKNIEAERLEEEKQIKERLAKEPDCETWLILKNSERLYLNTTKACHWVRGIIISARERAETNFDQQLRKKFLKVPILEGEARKASVEDKNIFRVVSFNDLAKIEFKILTKN